MIFDIGALGADYDRRALWQVWLGGLRAARRGEAEDANPRSTEPERSAWAAGHRHGHHRLTAMSTPEGP